MQADIHTYTHRLHGAWAVVEALKVASMMHVVAHSAYTRTRMCKLGETGGAS